ncbi:hypothetical protein C366_00384 [Cryptococcus neoformans Tu401-1]|nr:hypothetical protein C366_00384 [Cryptococcus neoformans var. grubii Tu401-1]
MGMNIPTDFPILHDSRNYHEWKEALEPEFAAWRCLAIVTGLEKEPLWDPESEGMMEVESGKRVMEGNRGLHVGSVIPEAATKDQNSRKVWESWNKREGEAMSLITKTVADYIRPNLYKFATSHDVWVYLAESYRLHDPELQSLALDKV